MRFIQGFFMSLGMFSSIPCPYRPWNETARSLMLAWLPWVGLVIGLIWYGLFYAMEQLAIPLQLEAAVLVLYPYLITGFIHLDGYMDTSDAILSRRPLEDKLRILKDPHTGAFAVISVVVLMLLCYGAMASVIERINLKQALGILNGDPMLSLVLLPMITRCGSSIAMMTGKPLAHSQYNVDDKKKKSAAEITAVVITLAGVVLTAYTYATGVFSEGASFAPFLVLLGGFAGYLISIISAARQLGGVSGDLAGYALSIAEASGLIVLAVIL
ncbi:adenosylcobinamide-GDP ribazoletransferase [Anoxybacterium hadale]|uniref:Adenosylcobinamide-GDP ribazoletransferase n=1 Tax=Anoxybacterium hadale TaxID=3408580 RepID=A0ACD1AFU8_9FIRM|nr:adenosylcobinamide-GDP ribazoletransferase [Clostridiales bacterium]